MRKIVFIFIALIAIGQNVCAQGMTATLQSGDNLSVFYGVDAFIEAYSEAKDGDQITLSAGTFDAPIESITKSVKITGVGAYEGSAVAVFASLTASGKNIRIEGIKFTNKLYVSGSTNLIVTRCWIEELNANSNYTNALFDQCVCKNIDGMPYASGFTFKNCTINKFSSTNSVLSLGLISNCVIYYYGYHYAYAKDKNSQPYAVYKNNVLGTYFYSRFLDNHNQIPCQAPSEYYNNVGINMVAGCEESIYFSATGCVSSGNIIKTYTELFGGKENYPAKPQNAPYGDDGTVVGPYGGTGFSEYPAIPRIISKDIDGKTDEDGKINVKIEVKAEN